MKKTKYDWLRGELYVLHTYYPTGFWDLAGWSAL